MSRKHRTDTATSATDGDRHPHAVADGLGQQNTPSTEDKVRSALTGNPGSTTAELAMAGGVGRSTAAKILARWGRDGTAIRTAGDGPSNPDTWTLARPASDAVAAQSDTTVMTSIDDATCRTDADDTPALSRNGDDDGAMTSTDTASADSEGDETEHEPPAGAAPAVSESADRIARDKDRLPKGGLRALVEEYLTEHPGESFGPAKIGMELGRSGGAVNNALEKLVTDGYAIKTCEAPKRFAINPDKTCVPETTAASADPASEA